MLSSNQRKKLCNEGCPKIESPTAYKRKVAHLSRLPLPPTFCKQEGGDAGEPHKSRHRCKQRSRTRMCCLSRMTPKLPKESR